MKKLTLGQRIVRLEKLLSTKSKKNESALPRNMYRDLRSIFEDRFCGEGYFDSLRNFKDHMWALSQGEDDDLVREAIHWMADDFDYDEESLDDYYDEIADDLAQMADDVLHDWDIDDDELDEFDESCKRRATRNEKAIAKKPVKRDGRTKTTRLEKRFNKNERRTRKCEGTVEPQNENGARAVARRIAKEFARMTGIRLREDSYGKDIVCSPIYGWAPANDPDIADDPEARFVFPYTDGYWWVDIIPEDNKVQVSKEDGIVVGPDGEELDYDVDCPQDGAFVLSAWKDFNPKMADESRKRCR